MSQRWYSSSSHRLKRHLLQVRKKQGRSRGFILLLPQDALLSRSDAGSDGVKPTSIFLSKKVRPRNPSGARCMGHVIKKLCTFCSEALHSPFGKRARPHLCMDEWNCAKTIYKQLILTQAVRVQIYSNRPGTNHGYKNMETGCILIVLRVPSIVRPLRSADAKSVRLFKRFPAADKIRRLNISFTWRAFEDLLKRPYRI